MATNKLTRPEELMAITKLSESVNAMNYSMNYSNDSASINFATLGRSFIQLRSDCESEEDFLEELKGVEVPIDKIYQAIRFYAANPGVLDRSFSCGENNPVNLKSREHPDNLVMQLF